MLEFDENCSICKREKQPGIPVLYEDAVCWVTYCSSHPTQPIIFLNRHVRWPGDSELKHMMEVADRLFPGHNWVASLNNPSASMPEHYHLHG